MWCVSGYQLTRSLMSQMIRSWSILNCTPMLSGRWPRHAPWLRNMAAPSVQPLGRVVLVGQADSNARRRDTPVAGEVVGGIHQQVQCHAAATARLPRSGGSAGSRAIHWQGPSIREASRLVPLQVCVRLSRKPPEYLRAAGVATAQLNNRQALLGLFSALEWPLPWVPDTQLALRLALLGHRPEHMSQSGSDVQRRPATQDFIERDRKHRNVS